MSEKREVGAYGFTLSGMEEVGTISPFGIVGREVEIVRADCCGNTLDANFVNVKIAGKWYTILIVVEGQKGDEITFRTVAITTVSKVLPALHCLRCGTTLGDQTPTHTHKWCEHDAVDKHVRLIKQSLTL